MKYARIDPLTQAVTIIEIEQATYEALVEAANPKAAYLRPLVIDPRPTPTASQVVNPGPIVIEPTQARQTWVLVSKSAEQLADETQQTELAQLKAMIATLQAGTGTAAERLVRVERVCAWLLKGYK